MTTVPSVPPPAAPPAVPPSAVSPPVFSPLHDVHVEAGASFTDFAGWQMPVRYSSDLAEHHAVRSAAGIFDLSHMAEIRVFGPDAPAYLDYALAGRISATAIGQAKYSLLLTEQGGIVDDLVVYRVGDDDFLVVANAGNHAEAFEALRLRVGSFRATVVDSSDETALIAVQGPRSREIVGQVVTVADSGDLETLKYYWSTPATFGAVPVLVARTGYTGEDGFELYVGVAAAAELWAALVAVGAPFGLVPAGLASRDTLRLEAGMPLYGHELGLDTLPAQAGLGRVPNLAKEAFVGRGAVAEPEHPEARVLVGLVGEGRRAARAGYELFENDTAGVAVGIITSGALSPTLGVPVAMAYVDPGFSRPETELVVDIRGKRMPFRVTTLPFYRRERS